MAFLSGSRPTAAVPSLLQDGYTTFGDADDADDADDDDDDDWADVDGTDEPTVPAFAVMNLDGISLPQNTVDNCEEPVGLKEVTANQDHLGFTFAVNEPDVSPHLIDPPENPRVSAPGLPVEETQGSAMASDNEGEDDAGDGDKKDGEEVVDMDDHDDSDQVPEQTTERVYQDVPNPNNVPVHDFHMAVMLLMTTTDMSHAQYQAFVETMKFATMDAIQSLPESLTTLRERCRRNMPLMKIRTHKIPIVLRAVPPKKKSPANAYRFEVEDYAKMWLSDPRITPRMHFGLGVLDERPDTLRTEFYHGDSWLGSIRTTSGQFAFIAGDDEPLFPSDCVARSNPSLPLLRVYGVGQSLDGKINLLCKRLLPPSEVPFEWRYDWAHLCQKADQHANTQVPIYSMAASDLPELVLMDDDRVIVPLLDVTAKVWVHFLDYAVSEELTAGLLPNVPSYVVRRIAYLSNNYVRVRNVHQRHRLPAENELMHLGREHCIKTFVQAEQGIRRISIPLVMFLDDFGLYRNAYHSLGGLYMQPANLDEPSRFTLQNMFVLMLTPFGSDESTIAACLAEETVPLGQGMPTVLRSGEKVILTVFPLCVTGDMPQQNANCGVMSHKSKMGCRYCFQPTEDRGILNDEVLHTGRYKQHHDALYQHLQQQAHGKSKKVTHDIFASVGVAQIGHIFRECFPMLDPFQAYPNDPMHAELRLAKYYHQVLIEDILSGEGLDAYAEAWNRMPLPFGWGVPQNPISHKGSMVFSEHGRIAQLNPFVLLLMFRYNTGCPKFSDASGKSFFKRGMAGRVSQACGVPPTDLNIGERLLATAFAVSQVLYLTHKSSLSPEEFAALPSIVLKVCIPHYQRLLAEISSRRAELSWHRSASFFSAFSLPPNANNATMPGYRIYMWPCTMLKIFATTEPYAMPLS